VQLTKSGENVECLYSEVYGDDVGKATVKYCEEYNVSLVVIGRSQKGELSDVSSFILENAPWYAELMKFDCCV
jgi:K+-sensing histidine kinase KdpD